MMLLAVFACNGNCPTAAVVKPPATLPDELMLLCSYELLFIRYLLAPYKF